jgi:hypothetical protein
MCEVDPLVSLGHWGRTTAQDAWSPVLYRGRWVSFSHSALHVPLMVPFNKSKTFTLPLQLAHTHISLAFEGCHLPFEREIFTKWRSREHSADHTEIFNSAHDNRGLRASPHPQGCVVAHRNLKFLLWSFFWLFLFIIFWLCLVKATCNKSVNKEVPKCRNWEYSSKSSLKRKSQFECEVTGYV